MLSQETVRPGFGMKSWPLRLGEGPASVGLTAQEEAPRLGVLRRLGRQPFQL